MSHSNKNTTMKTCIQSLAILAFATSVSFAQEEAPKGPRGDKRPDPAKVFAKLDADSDGSLTLAEFQAAPMAKRNPERAEKGFAKMDADSDGMVTLEEFKAHRPERPVRKGKGKGKKADGAPEGE